MSCTSSQHTRQVVTRRQTKRFLVVQLARFGDLIQTKRLILSLLHEGCSGQQDRQCPQAALQQGSMQEVHLLVDTSLEALARLVYPEVIVHTVPAHVARQSAPWQLMEHALNTFETLRYLSFDRVYITNFSGLSISISALFDPDCVQGYRVCQGQVQQDVWMQMVQRGVSYRPFAGLNLMDVWGLLAAEPVPATAVNPVPVGRGGGVGLVLAGRHARRSLPVQTLAALAGAVVRHTGARRLVLLGSGTEQPLVRRLTDILPRPLREITHDTVGQTDWQGLIHTLQQLDMLLSPDTGTMHLAAHLGIPVQAFFLSSAWVFETGPYGEGHTIWQANRPCTPCLEAAECPYDTVCANAFSQRALLRHIAAQPVGPEAVPDSITGYTSSFDPIGQIYIPHVGEDIHAGPRKQYRRLMQIYWGLSEKNRALSTSGGSITPLAPDFVRDFCYETDWMIDSRHTRHRQQWSRCHG